MFSFNLLRRRRGVFSLGCIINLFVLLNQLTSNTCNAAVSKQTALDLNNAQSQWYDGGAGVGILDYDFTYKLTCDCEDGATQRMKVQVRENTITSVTYEETGEKVPIKYSQYVHTIDDLFKEIAMYIGQDVHALSVEYDPKYSYPKIITVDETEMIDDDERTILVSRLRYVEPIEVIDDEAETETELSTTLMVSTETTSGTLTTSGATETVVTKEPTDQTMMIPSQKEIDIHETAQELWESFAIGNYNYVYHRSGELPPEATRPMKVQVRDNRVSSVSYESDDTEVPEDWANIVPTMDGLFDMLGDIAEDGVSSWNVKYDEDLGYIMNIDIDVTEEKLDEEIRIKIRDVEVIAPPTVTIVDDNTDPFEPNYDNPPLSPDVGMYLKSNRTLWDSLNITNYEFTYQKVCFCIIDATQEMRVNVRNGNEIIDATYIQDDSPVDDPYISIIKTVNDFFDMIQNYVEDDVNGLVVSYDVEMGYPTRISIDEHEKMKDDENEYYAKDLVPLVTVEGSEGIVVTSDSTKAANTALTTTSATVATPTSTPEETMATVTTTMVTESLAMGIIDVKEKSGYCPTLHADFLRRMSTNWNSNVPFTQENDEQSIEGTNDSTGERHTPFIILEGTTEEEHGGRSTTVTTATIKVGVEGNYHPMIASDDPDVIHWITHIYAVDQDGKIVIMRVMDPVVSEPAMIMFDVPSDVMSLTAFAFCNKHGLYQGPTVSVLQTSDNDYDGKEMIPCSFENPAEVSWLSIHADLLRRQHEEFNSFEPFGPVVKDKMEEKFEMHTPQITDVNGDMGTVLVGIDDMKFPLLHPMTPLEEQKDDDGEEVKPPHFIMYIYVMDQDGEIITMQSLDPTEMDDASIVFTIPPNAQELTPYSFCNIDGLWVGPTHVLESDEEKDKEEEDSLSLDDKMAGAASDGVVSETNVEIVTNRDTITIASATSGAAAASVFAVFQGLIIAAMTMMMIGNDGFCFGGH